MVSSAVLPGDGGDLAVMEFDAEAVPDVPRGVIEVVRVGYAPAPAAAPEAAVEVAGEQDLPAGLVGQEVPDDGLPARVGADGGAVGVAEREADGLG